MVLHYWDCRQENESDTYRTSTIPSMLPQSSPLLLFDEFLSDFNLKKKKEKEKEKNWP